MRLGESRGDNICNANKLQTNMRLQMVKVDVGMAWSHIVSIGKKKKSIHLKDNQWNGFFNSQNLY